MNYSAATITANCLDEEQELLHSPLCACSCLQQVWDHRVWSSAQCFRSEQVRIRLWLWWLTEKKINKKKCVACYCFLSPETGKDHLRGLFHTFLDRQKANALICVGRERCRKLFLLCHRDSGQKWCRDWTEQWIMCTRSAKSWRLLPANSQIFPKYFKCIWSNTAFQQRFCGYTLHSPTLLKVKQSAFLSATASPVTVCVVCRGVDVAPILFFWNLDSTALVNQAFVRLLRAESAAARWGLLILLER